eukprot:959916-Pelagomonas_calceolata.AAC.5
MGANTGRKAYRRKNENTTKARPLNSRHKLLLNAQGLLLGDQGKLIHNRQRHTMLRSTTQSPHVVMEE